MVGCCFDKPGGSQDFTHWEVKTSLTRRMKLRQGMSLPISDNFFVQILSSIFLFVPPGLCRMYYLN